MSEASIMQEEDETSMLESLLRACREGSGEDVEGIISACTDLDINSADERGETALHVASASGKIDAVTILLNNGANIAAMTESGDSVIHFAAKYGRLNVIKYLLTQHIQINCTNKWPIACCSLDRALEQIHSCENLEVLKRNIALSRLGLLAQFDTPLHYAASRSHEDVVDFLCQAGADYNAQNIRGSTPLHLSCEQCDIPTSLRLIHFACRTDLIDQNEETALHIACREDLQPVVQTMCAYGCPVDIFNKAGLAPLHIAARVGNTDIIRCLLLSGADIDRPNKEENRAEEIALAHGNTEAADLLNKVSLTITLDKRDIYIKQLLPTNRPVPSIKVKVFGHCGVGKTTLIESLKSGFIKSLISKAFPPPNKRTSIAEENNELPARSLKFSPPHVQYTKGIDIQRVNITDAGDLSTWEFSGFGPYHSIYDKFLGERNCIHVIVLSMKDSEEERHSQGRYWLNFLRARMAPNEPIGFGGSQLVSSRVLLVATHAAEAHCEKSSRGQYTDSSKAALVNSLLSEFGSDLLMAPNIIILDANQPSSTEMKVLRTTIATLKSFILQNLTPSLGLLESAVAVLPQWSKILSEFPVVTLSQFADYVRSKINILSTDEHISELKSQLQLIGEILSLKKDESEEEMIILSPQWLCSDVIGKLLSYDQIMKTPENGLLSAEFINAVFPKTEINAMINLLETLDILTTDKSGGQKTIEAPFYNMGERPKNVWQEEDQEFGHDAEGSVWGGVQISAAVGMHEQIICLFPRLQIHMKRNLSRTKEDLKIDNWLRGMKIRSGSLAAVLELQMENMSLELKCRGPHDQRSVLFFFQEELCDMIFTLINDCCPGMYLDRQPLSVVGLKQRKSPCPSYESRLILLAQIDGDSSVQLSKPSLGDSYPKEQLVDLFAFGSQEIFSHMKPGMDLHISNLSLYARYVFSSLLDPSNALGRDWCMLAIILGLTDLLPRVDISDAAALSKTDAILALYSRNPTATFKTLYEKLLTLDRPEAVDAILALTPLYRYTAPAGTRESIMRSASTSDRRQSQSSNPDRRQSQSAKNHVSSPTTSPKSPKAKFAIPYANGTNGKDLENGKAGEHAAIQEHPEIKSMRSVELSASENFSVENELPSETNSTDEKHSDAKLNKKNEIDSQSVPNAAVPSATILNLNSTDEEVKLSPREQSNTFKTIDDTHGSNSDVKYLADQEEIALNIENEDTSERETDKDKKSPNPEKDRVSLDVED